MIVDEKILISVIDKSGKIIDLHELEFLDSIKSLSIDSERKTFLVETLNSRDLDFNAMIENISVDKLKHIEKELLRKGYKRHVIKE